MQASAAVCLARGPARSHGGTSNRAWGQCLQALAEQLRPDAEGAGALPKALLRANTDEASARGVFGVPAFEVDGRLFWGLDSLPMLRAYLDGDAWFDGPAWDAAPAVPSGLPSVR